MLVCSKLNTGIAGASEPCLITSGAFASHAEVNQMVATDFSFRGTEEDDAVYGCIILCKHHQCALTCILFFADALTPHSRGSAPRMHVSALLAWDSQRDSLGRGARGEAGNHPKSLCTNSYW